MDNSIGERIKKRRKELNITQTQIQEKIGISSGNMSGIESGKSLPSATALIGLSSILCCSIDWILTGQSPKSEECKISNIEESLLTGFRELPEADQLELVEILNMKLRRLHKTRNTKTRSSTLIESDNNMAG